MITINEVQRMIEKLEAAGELSMKEEKYLELAKAFKQLAEENVAMRKTLGEVVYSSEEVEHDGCLTFVVNPDYVHDAADLLDGETTTTDRIVAGIKADGAKAAGDYLKLEAQHMPVVERLMMQDAAEICYGTAARLREGANHD
ncbi:hypothetical protein PRB81_gp28 [Klebsiella phage VLCpiS13f]|uniref:hypothetical protein n=1 Tax=Klebsiella phage VLCpiS13f TaxID=2874890 RepID=UPI00233EDD26|nr:hypothetical protein PRB81_gp28 [Klebsiella phage VLCpiS13f]UVX29577.1 hypothetical protein S13f_00068 [Klebsiella phage VLCpiS13f]